MNSTQNYIGILIEIEEFDDEFFWLYFDVFVGNRTVVNSFIKQNILDYTTGYIRLKFSNEQFNQHFKGKSSSANSLLNHWFELVSDYNKNDNAIEGQFYPTDMSETDQPQSIYFLKESITLIGKRKAVDREFLSLLNKLVDLEDLYEREKTATAFEELANKISTITNNSKVNVVSFNVGQGNATGIFDSNLKPICYYDLGGGAYWNKRTYTDIKEFPVNDNPFIILSHWDFDHYESIRARLLTYANCKIIAPLQVTTPSIRKFATSIADHLYLIKGELKNRKTFSFLKLFKSKGKTRNDSGLSLLLTLNKDEDISTVLLPGDSQYFYIKQKEVIDAICVSHHGGKLYSKRGFPIPREKGNGYCVYSYGKENTYRHPLPATIQEHVSKGWGCDRFHKKYSLSTNNYNVIYSCDIGISAIFNKVYEDTLGKFNSFHGLSYNRESRIREILSSIDND